MKTGMNLLLWTTHVTSEHFPLLGKLKAAGFDGVEIPLFDGDAAHFKIVAAELKKQGLGCTTVTVVGADTNPISPEPSIRKSAVERHKWAIEMTAILGGENLCGPFHSPLAVFSGEPPTEDEKKRCVEVMQQSAEIAKQNNVMLCIEYLNRFECYFLTTMADAAAYVRQVNHPAFGTMYDTFHANIEEKDGPGELRKARKEVFHIHISENDRGVPGTGHVPWIETFRAINEINFDGWLTIEAFGRALPALAAATKVWRDFFAKKEDVYEKGIAFMKSMVALTKA
jgi:D-psicose/D-tagatose/L-ribulose 3-epimerase